MTRARHAYAAPAWASEQRTGDVALKAVLLLLANYADENYTCYPSQGRIADETEQCVRTVRDQLAVLQEVGLIVRRKHYDDRGKRGNDRFWLQLDVTVTAEQTQAARARVLARRAPRKGSEEAAPDTSEVTAEAPSEGLPATSAGSDPGSTTGNIGGTTGNAEHGDYRQPGCRVTPRELLGRTPTAPAEADADGKGVPAAGAEGKAVPATRKEAVRAALPDAQALQRRFHEWWATENAPVLNGQRAAIGVRNLIAEAIADGYTLDECRRALYRSDTAFPGRDRWQRLLVTARTGREPAAHPMRPAPSNRHTGAPTDAETAALRARFGE